MNLCFMHEHASFLRGTFRSKINPSQPCIAPLVQSYASTQKQRHNKVNCSPLFLLIANATTKAYSIISNSSEKKKAATVIPENWMQFREGQPHCGAVEVSWSCSETQVP